MIQKRFLIFPVAFAAVLIAGAAFAAPSTTLKTFADGDAVVTVDGPDSATIVLPNATDSGGVYIQPKSQGGKRLSRVDFSFTSSGDVQGGAPRLSIPIDTGGSASIDGYAFLDAAGCGATVGDNTGNVATVVSTKSSNCHVNFDHIDYANWDAFAAANPTYRTTPGAIPFIIADGTAGTYKVTNIVLKA